MREAFTVFIGDGPWRVACAGGGAARVAAVPLPAEAAPEAALDVRAGAARQKLAELGHVDQPVVLAVASAWCLSATFSTDDLDRGNRRRAMAFRLEEQLPISAEEFIADYLPAAGGQALGVCAELAKLQSIVSALQAAGIDVRHVCPAALMAAAYAVDEHDDIAGVMLVAPHDGADGPAVDYDLIEIHKAAPTRWWWFAHDSAALTERLAAWAASSDLPKRLAVVDFVDDDAPAKADPWPLPQGIERIDMPDLAADQAAALQAARILEDVAPPWIDLRRDALAAPGRRQAYRKPAAVLGVAALALLVCVSVAMQWRGRQYEALGRQYAQQQADVFKAALPDQRVPGDVRGRLASEQRKLAGLCGQGADAPGGGAALQEPSALAQLRTVLSSTPTDVRWRILDLNIQPDLVRIDGQARTHSEAERIAAGLRQSGAYEVEAPKTQALRDAGVSFLFTAKPLAAAAAPTGGPR